jgi:hypothetical protein
VEGGDGGECEGNKRYQDSAGSDVHGPVKPATVCRSTAEYRSVSSGD